MMHKFKLCIRKLLVIFVAFRAATVNASELVGDGKDHPLLSRMPGYTVYEKVARNFDAVSLRDDSTVVNGKISGAGFPLVYDGKLTSFQYRDEKRKASNYAVCLNYAMAIRSLGGHQLNTEFPLSCEGIMYGNQIFAIPHKSGASTIVLLNIDEPRQYFLTIIEPTTMT